MTLKSGGESSLLDRVRVELVDFFGAFEIVGGEVWINAAIIMIALFKIMRIMDFNLSLLSSCLRMGMLFKRNLSGLFGPLPAESVLNFNFELHLNIINGLRNRE